MKSWLRTIFLLTVVLLILRTPDYWDIFKDDENEYVTRTFYGVVKEECLVDEKGKTFYADRLTDIEDGDILVTDSVYCFCYRHGHAAIVIDAERGITLEAYGLGTVSEYASLSEWERYPHVLVLRLDAPKEVRSQIAEYAAAYLWGIPYSLTAGLEDNKSVESMLAGTQCAHLVWSAYKKFGYDIDGDGGLLVTPHDFTRSWLLNVVPQE